MPTGLLVGTRQGLYEFDGAEQRTRIADREVRSLLTQHGDFWAIIDQQEIWRSETGHSWQRTAALKDLRANCLMPVPDGLWVGASQAHLFALRDKEFDPVDSFEQIEGRASWYTPRGHPPDVRTMSTDPDGTRYINVHVGGVLRSIDGGQTWESTIDMDKDVHQIVFDEPSRLVLAASAYGLAISDDRGKSWHIATEGLHGNYLRAVAVTEDTALVTASTGPRTSQACVYRRPVGIDGSFTRCQRGLPRMVPR